MKYVKMLGLAAMAVMALTAFLGVGSASATILCKTNIQEGCAASGWDYPAGTEIHMTLEPGSLLILTGAFGVTSTCIESTVLGKTANTGGSTETIHGPINVLTLAGCNCTVEMIAGGELEIHWISGSTNGTLTNHGTREKFNCSGVTCFYGNGDLGTVTGGAEATIDFNATFEKEEGSSFLCGGTAVWEGGYAVTSPKPLYVSKN
jgi:hypothetical protein